MTTLLAFLVTLSVLIVVHECGHYLVARWCGVRVLRFSVGLGHVLFRRTLGRDATEFVLSALPLGGYVRMLDEREGPVAPEALGQAFNRQPVGKRILITLAGPLANLLLAVLLYWALFMSGLPGVRPILGEVQAGSPAAHAGFKSGQLVVRVGDTAVTTWQDVRWSLLEASVGQRSIEVETVDAARHINHHLLALDRIRPDVAETDPVAQLGMETYRPVVPARIGEILPGGVAERSGLRVGDEILALDGLPIRQWREFSSRIRQMPGRTVVLEVQRGTERLRIAVTPEPVHEGKESVGRIGAAYHLQQDELDRLLVTVSYPAWPALQQALGKTWDTAAFSLRMLGAMLTGKVSWQGLSGPVTIADYAGQSAQFGWKSFAGFLALVSVSLGVLNLLPIPVLDGGHLMYYMAEIFKGGPLPERVVEMGQRVGFALLGLLMAVALYNDINRLITG